MKSRLCPSRGQRRRQRWTERLPDASSAVLARRYDKRQNLRGTGRELGPEFEHRLEKEAFCSGKLEARGCAHALQNVYFSFPDDSSGIAALHTPDETCLSRLFSWSVFVRPSRSLAGLSSPSALRNCAWRCHAAVDSVPALLCTAVLDPSRPLREPASEPRVQASEARCAWMRVTSHATCTHALLPPLPSAAVASPSRCVRLSAPLSASLLL
eukprot:1825393-Pleurochrysis_carterae.AAC.1